MNKTSSTFRTPAANRKVALRASRIESRLRRWAWTSDHIFQRILAVPRSRCRALRLPCGRPAVGLDLPPPLAHAQRGERLDEQGSPLSSQVVPRLLMYTVISPIAPAMPSPITVPVVVHHRTLQSSQPETITNTADQVHDESPRANGCRD